MGSSGLRSNRCISTRNSFSGKTSTVFYSVLLSLSRLKKSGGEAQAKELSESLATAKNLFLAKDALLIAQQVNLFCLQIIL